MFVIHLFTLPPSFFLPPSFYLLLFSFPLCSPFQYLAVASHSGPFYFGAPLGNSTSSLPSHRHASLTRVALLSLRTNHRPLHSLQNCIHSVPGLLDCLTLKDGTYRLFRNVGNKLPIYAV